MSDLSNTSLTKLSINVFYDAKTRNSFCWKYFGHLITTDQNKKRIVKPEQVFCSACLTAVKKESEDISFGSVKVKCYSKTVSTGNMTRHLRDAHNIKDEATGTDNVRNTKDFSTTSSPAKSNCTSGLSKKRHDKRLLARDLCLWFCKSLLPFDSVADEGMLDFFKKYNIAALNNDVPTRQTVSGTALLSVYESMLSKVKESICVDCAHHFALTFDLWTDQYRSLDYITFTLHYLTPSFELKAFTLSTELMTGQRTGEEINEAIQEIKTRFNLEDKHILAVTDARSNVETAVTLANMSYHLCLGHGLHNLVTVDGINSVEEISTAVTKCKEIVKAVRNRAPQLQAEAKKAQQQFLATVDDLVDSLEQDENNPIFETDIPSPYISSIETPKATRWHIVLEMLESVINVYRDPINNMLDKIGQDELKLKEIEWILLKDLVTFLISLREAVEILSSQTTCTLNVALVFRSEIMDVLNSQTDDESIIISRLKQNMMDEINKRFPVSDEVVAAALLDNRFMGLKEIDGFLDSHNTTRTSFLAAYIKENIKITDIPQTKTVAEKNNKSLLLKLSRKHSINACQGIEDDPIEQEVWRYITAANASEPKDGNLLLYWNNRKDTFPYLAALAKALLCVPATSTTSEKVFSKAGLTFAAKRSRLNPTRVNKIIFIHDNYKMCEDGK